MMICALAELQALVQKAAIGAGMPWGIAEEAARTARWLLAHDLPGLKSLLILLENQPHNAYDDVVPITDKIPWQARGGVLCPLLSGITISDYATQIIANEKIELATVSFPIILTPFVSLATTATMQPLKLNWPDVEIICTSHGIYTTATNQQLATNITPSVQLSKAGASQQRSDLPFYTVKQHNATINASIWKRFNQLAQRTYVPASEDSRQRGAGSGHETDND